VFESSTDIADTYAIDTAVEPFHQPISSLFSRGDMNEAAKYWKKGAKAGVPTAMFRLGLHLYKGDIHALGRNTEDTLMWLQRFLVNIDPPSIVRPSRCQESSATRERTQVSACRNWN
jgi:TPR repeat protein